MSKPSETIWASMIAARQLSWTYYTLSTCLTDLLHRYFEHSHVENKEFSTSLFHNLDETLFSSITSVNQSKLLDEYSTILLNILKQNSLHANIVQNVRRLFRSDSCLKRLFTTELSEYCQCQECDCTISNSIIDVVHDIGEFRSDLLIQSNETSCACFRCGDQNQTKTLKFKQLSSCLAFTVNRLNIKATEQLTNSENVTYELVYIIEFDSTARSILNVYLREDDQFIQVDGANRSNRCSTIIGQGKFLTLWLSQTNPTRSNLATESVITVTHSETFLSPPESTSSSSSQLISNSNVNTNESMPFQTTSSTTIDDILVSTNSSTIDNVVENNVNNNRNNDDEDDEFWNSLNDPSTSVTSENVTINQSHDSVTDMYLTLLNSTQKNSSPIKSRAEHDRAVNSLATDVLWPLILDHTNRRSEKKALSSATTTTERSVSSNSSTISSAYQRNSSYKQTPSICKSRRSHPYKIS